MGRVNVKKLRFSLRWLVEECHEIIFLAFFEEKIWWVGDLVVPLQSLLGKMAG